MITCALAALTLLAPPAVADSKTELYVETLFEAVDVTGDYVNLVGDLVQEKVSPSIVALKVAQMAKKLADLKKQLIQQNALLSSAQKAEIEKEILEPEIIELFKQVDEGIALANKALRNEDFYKSEILKNAVKQFEAAYK